MSNSRKREADCMKSISSHCDTCEPVIKTREQAAVELSDCMLSPLKSCFFARPCIDVAKSLLGCILVRNLEVNGQSCQLRARIVETEAYLGGGDRASHSFNGKKTNRNKAMYMSPGTGYVYKIYGMYSCFNISTAGPGAAVLIRAAEPLLGLDTMATNRTKPKSTKPLAHKQLLNGPSKLCQALCISKEAFDQVDLTLDSSLFLICDDFQLESSSLVSTSRIGIENYGQEWSEKPLRFYIQNNTFVSRK